MPAGHPLVKTLRAGVLALCAFAALAAASAPPRRCIRARTRCMRRPPTKEPSCRSTRAEWANWKALFAEFRKRYPKVEITYNDIGSAATVVSLDKSRRRPQADTAYYFAASALDAESKDVVAPFKPVNFDKLPDVFRSADGRWFAVHSLNIAFLVNRKLVKNVPQRWSDLLKPEYRNAVVYLDPRSTGQGRSPCSRQPMRTAAASRTRSPARNSSAS